MSKSEQHVLRTFRQFLVTPGQMLCFYGPDLKKHGSALQTMTDKKWLIKETFLGGYSLTNAGFAAMHECE